MTLAFQELYGKNPNTSNADKLVMNTGSNFIDPTVFLLLMSIAYYCH